MTDSEMEHITVTKDDLSHLVHYAASGTRKGSSSFLKKFALRFRPTEPWVSDMVISELRASPTRAVPQADVAQPIDIDSRLSLIKETSVAELMQESPILNFQIESQLRQLVNEQLRSEMLVKVGLEPTRTALFVGEPGVGKTISAEWIARELGVPLFTLDLSAVMSSFLGKTGANVRRVFEFARSTPCVFFLDELDAVAKKRDDSGEIGELKRLVTVLLQEIDAWPSGSLLLAATNHEKLLDPAVWRRFESIVEFPLPGREEIHRAVDRFLGPVGVDTSKLSFLSSLYEGKAISAIELSIKSSLRRSVLENKDPLDVLLEHALLDVGKCSSSMRAKLAAEAQQSSGLSARSISELTGVSRTTLRKYANRIEDGDLR